jgi:hypothetical protein
MQLIAGFVDNYLRLSEDEEAKYEGELKQLAPEEKERIMEVRMSWRERDRQEFFQEGKLEGKLEGKHEGMVTLMTRLVEHRFGPIDQATHDRIAHLPSEQLEELGDVLLDLKDLEDLSNWLRAR